VFRQRSSLFCMLIVISIKHNLKPIHHHRFVHQRLKRPPKIFKPFRLSRSLSICRSDSRTTRVVFGLWVFVMHLFLVLFSMCHWFLSCSILLEIMLLSERSPLYMSKSSNEGQIMLPTGRSPLYATKSSNEGQIMLPSGRSLLCETKSSDEGQIILA
jgi:hypothetical protein